MSHLTLVRFLRAWLSWHSDRILRGRGLTVLNRLMSRPELAIMWDIILASKLLILEPVCWSFGSHLIRPVPSYVNSNMMYPPSAAPPQFDARDMSDYFAGMNGAPAYHMSEHQGHPQSLKHPCAYPQEVYQNVFLLTDLRIIQIAINTLEALLHDHRFSKSLGTPRTTRDLNSR